ncbi:hypothetical protein FDENT_10744 [Fusarium denticulatum]|uniref:Uncharacterized protein n=1 Tax=Fusarium denticulatum TaxID=48507 RepID=A0A8H5WVK9_9HYPO|nr:hypothetical protein FDENT_10744 [Fusarium denticulatum]
MLRARGCWTIPGEGRDMVVHTHAYGVAPLARAYSDLTRSGLRRDCIDKLKREPGAVFDNTAPMVCHLVVTPENALFEASQHRSTTPHDPHSGLASDQSRLQLLLNEHATVDPQQLMLSGKIPIVDISHETDFQVSQIPVTPLSESNSLPTVLGPNTPAAQALTTRFDVGQGGNVLNNSGWSPNDQSGGRGSNDRSSPWSKSFLACPYYIRDPIRHFGCIGLKLDTYGRVKQHLKRNHLSFDTNKVEGFACESCGVVSPDESSRDSHRVSIECVPATSENERGVSRQAWERLEKRLKSGSADEEKWLNMWFVLFHQPLGTSIPIKDTVMNRFFQIIRNFCQVDGFRGILSLLIQEMHGVELGSEMQMYEVLMKLLDFIRDSIQQLFDTEDAAAIG